MCWYYIWSVALPHGAVGWSAVCDCGASWSYSLTFCSYITQFLRSWRLLKMAIYQPFAMPLVMPQPWFWSDSINFWVLILSCSLSGNGNISFWQAFSNARDSIQEAFCSLHPVSLKSSVTGALEEYVNRRRYCLTEWRWWMFWRKKLPPSRATFLEVVKRVHYQFILWKSATDINPDKPIPDSYGWKRDFGYGDIAFWPWSPSAADKMWLQQVCMRNISVEVQS